MRCAAIILRALPVALAMVCFALFVTKGVGSEAAREYLAGFGLVCLCALVAVGCVTVARWFEARIGGG